MESTLFILLLTIAAIGIALVLFAGWLVLAVLKGAVRLGARAVGFAGGGGRSIPIASITCPRKRCHAVNPPEARFCRRCGIALPALRRAAGNGGSSLSRAAVW
jgi:hypothetical protein